MDNSTFQATEDLLGSLSERIRKFRLSKDLLREDVAKKSGVSLRTLSSLEKSGRSTIETLLRVLRAFGEPSPLNSVVATTPVSPMALLRTAPDPKRTRRRRQLSASDNAGSCDGATEKTGHDAVEFWRCITRMQAGTIRALSIQLGAV